MTGFCWFGVFGRAPVVPEAGFLAATPGAERVLVHTPGVARDPYLDDGAPPALVVQAYFAGLEAMEGALAAGGHLAGLAERMPGAEGVQQGMVVRGFPVPEPGDGGCTYLVSYEGVAADPAGWLGHYVRSHTPIMARFPGVRAVEVYSRVDWLGALPWPRVEALQRNKVVFDDAAALTAALNSPVRHEMRADFRGFPAFEGRNTHYPMTTRVLR